MRLISQLALNEVLVVDKFETDIELMKRTGSFGPRVKYMRTQTKAVSEIEAAIIRIGRAVSFANLVVPQGTRGLDGWSCEVSPLARG